MHVEPAVTKSKETEVLYEMQNHKLSTLLSGPSKYVHGCARREVEKYGENVNAINTLLERFLRNCNHLIEPLDQMVLWAFKPLFSKEWNTKRAEQGRSLAYISTGRLTNQGKHYYLTLVKECVDELNAWMIGDLSIARKSMIMCGLIPDVDCDWKVEQLTEDLQQIVNQNIKYFNGLHPSQWSMLHVDSI